MAKKITALYTLTITNKEGANYLLHFVDDMLMFDAHLEAEKQGFSTDYHNFNARIGKAIQRDLNSVKEVLDFAKTH